MATQQSEMTHSVNSSSLADILERVLDKGVVIAGDIKIKLVDIELLTIQIRLLIASVDKAQELGIDWWMFNPDLSSGAAAAPQADDLAALRERIDALEAQTASAPVSGCASQPRFNGEQTSGGSGWNQTASR